MNKANNKNSYKKSKASGYRRLSQTKKGKKILKTRRQKGRKIL